MRLTVKPKQKRAIESRKIILESASDLFEKKGFYNTNTKEIAQYAGVSIGLFYKYFNDKVDIFIEVFQRNIEQVEQKMKNAMEKCFKVEEKRELVKNFITYYVKYLSQWIHLYEDIEIIEREFSAVKSMSEQGDERLNDIVLKFISSICDSSNAKSMDIPCKILITTIKANASKAAKIEEPDEKEEYIDVMTSLIYDYIFKMKFRAGKTINESI